MSSSLKQSRYCDRYFGLTNGAKDAAMDGALWGKLQGHIDLAKIFVKLPLASFFRLRQVCKKWNRLASDREFLERTFNAPFADPFFVVTTRMWGDRLLTCQAPSLWSSMPLPLVKCAVSGLLFESRCEFSDTMRILDLHTRVFHKLPDIPTTMLQKMNREELEDQFHDLLFGMTVDTTLFPHSFRVFLLEECTGTCIYDSKSGAWTQKPTTYDSAMEVDRKPTCVNHNQFLYIKALGWFGSTFGLHVYDLQRDKWNFDKMGAFEVPEQEFCSIGLWREQLFAFGLKFSVVTVWETDQLLGKRWTQFDSMWRELCAWIAIGKDKYIEHIQSVFCNENVLLYNCIGGVEKAVLYNLDRQTWEKAALPAFPPHLQQLLQ